MVNLLLAFHKLCTDSLAGVAGAAHTRSTWERMSREGAACPLEGV